MREQNSLCLTINTMRRRRLKRLDRRWANTYTNNAWTPSMAM
jgi:hypothetical protein